MIIDSQISSTSSLSRPSPTSQQLCCTPSRSMDADRDAQMMPRKSLPHSRLRKNPTVSKMLTRVSSNTAPSESPSKRAYSTQGRTAPRRRCFKGWNPEVARKISRALRLPQDSDEESSQENIPPLPTTARRHGMLWNKSKKPFYRPPAAPQANTERVGRARLRAILEE